MFLNSDQIKSFAQEIIQQIAKTSLLPTLNECCNTIRKHNEKQENLREKIEELTDKTEKIIDQYEKFTENKDKIGLLITQQSLTQSNYEKQMEQACQYAENYESLSSEIADVLSDLDDIQQNHQTYTNDTVFNTANSNDTTESNEKNNPNIKPSSSGIFHRESDKTRKATNDSKYPDHNANHRNHRNKS